VTANDDGRESDVRACAHLEEVEVAKNGTECFVVNGQKGALSEGEGVSTSR
jgi:hypothetical protein